MQCNATQTHTIVCVAFDLLLLVRVVPVTIYLFIYLYIYKCVIVYLNDCNIYIYSLVFALCILACKSPSYFSLAMDGVGDIGRGKEFARDDPPIL